MCQVDLRTAGRNKNRNRLLPVVVLFKGSIFLKYRLFLSKKNFNKLIYTVLSANPAHLSYCAGHNFNTEKKIKCILVTLQSLANVEPVGLHFSITSLNLLSV